MDPVNQRRAMRLRAVSIRNRSSDKGGVSVISPAGRTLALVMGVMLSGCDSLPTVSTRFVTGLSSEERAKAAEMPVYSEKLSGDSYRVIGPVMGLSCQIAHDDAYAVSEENAREELQRATFKAGGNAVMEVSCTQFARSEGTSNCFRSVECGGTAIRTREASRQ